MQRFELKKPSAFFHFVFQRKILESQSSNPTQAGRSFWIGILMVLHSPNTHPQQLPPKLLYMALFSCVNDTIAICFVGQRYSQTKKGSKWPKNDQIRRRRHTGTHDQGSEVRGSQGPESYGGKRNFISC